MTKNVSVRWVKALDAAGQFKGIASVYGNTDLGGDVVDKGAFTKSLQERGNQVPILWQHDQHEPIGKGTVTDTSGGLMIAGQLSLGTSRGKDAYELLKDGVVNGLSIGYDVEKQSYADGARHLQEVKLFEVSVVTFPMNTEATIDSVKRAIKEGRVLSAANRDQLQRMHDDISEHLKALGDLLEATDPSRASDPADPETVKALMDGMRRNIEIFRQPIASGESIEDLMRTSQALTVAHKRLRQLHERIRKGLTR